MAAEEVDENKSEKLITATKKGGAVLDQWLPDTIKSNYHVLQHVCLHLAFFFFNLNSCRLIDIVLILQTK